MHLLQVQERPPCGPLRPGWRLHSRHRRREVWVGKHEGHDLIGRTEFVTWNVCLGGDRTSEGAVRVRLGYPRWLISTSGMRIAAAGAARWRGGGPSQRWNVGEAFEESIEGGSTVVYSIGLGLGQWMTASMPCSSSFASSNCPLLESFGA